MSFFSRVSIRHSVRGRLLLLAVLVEGVMLTLLVSNSIRLVRDYMTDQVRDHAAQIGPVLNAALVAPLAQRDYSTVQAVLDESRLQGGIQYLVVLDEAGKRVGSSGWPLDKALPRTVNDFSGIESDLGNVSLTRFDVMRPVELAGQKLGTLHFGLDLSRILVARQALFNQGALIAVIELLLSAGVLTLLGLWMTRHVADLRKASEAVTAGNLTPPPVAEGDDEIGRLGAAFNAMSRAVAERVADITAARDEQMQLKEGAKQEHTRLIALLSAMDIGVLLLDESRNVVFSNGAFHRVWGLDGNRSLAGRSARDVFSQISCRPLAGDPIPFAGGLEESRGGSAPVEIELNDKRILRRRSRLVADPDGRVTGLLWLFEDVTTAKEAERRLFDALRAAEAASEAKVAFLATMSHEIRTPMNGILGMTDLVLQSELGAEQREQLHWVKSSADSLLSILNDVLDFAKIDAQRLTLERIPFDLADLARSCVGLYSMIAREKSLALNLCMVGECPPRVVGDPVRLRQVITNLLSNALKFTPEGGKVTLTVTRQPDIDAEEAFEISVADTGVGIPAEKLEHIFSPFAQADSSTTRRFGGTGLGLAIVSRLVDLMGGQIRVESVTGQGSVFHFNVRFGRSTVKVDASPALAQPSATGPGSGGIGGQRVLLVEDTPVNQVLAQTMLRKNGFHVTLARDGLEALSALEQGVYDVVLMDVQMPNLDGLEATRRLRVREAEKGSRIPVIALTANAMDSDREMCFAAGMDDFVRKPFRVDEMLAAIHRQLGRPPASAG